MKINRKPLQELTSEELLKNPIWVYDHGETVYPTSFDVHPDPQEDQTTYIVLTTFILNDGTKLVGYCSPADDSGIDYIQPVIIANGSHIALWDEDNGCETKKELIAKRLSKSVNDIFPLKYSSNILCEDHILKDIINAA